MKSINMTCHNCEKYYILKYTEPLEEYLDNHKHKAIFCSKCRKELREVEQVVKCEVHKDFCKSDCINKVHSETIKEVHYTLQTEVYENSDFETTSEGITFWTLIEQKLKELEKVNKK